MKELPVSTSQETFQPATTWRPGGSWPREVWWDLSFPHATVPGLASRGHNTFLFSPQHKALHEAVTNSYDKLQNLWQKWWQCWHHTHWESSQDACNQAPLLSWLSWQIPKLTRALQRPSLHWHSSRSWQQVLHILTNIFKEFHSFKSEGWGLDSVKNL